MALLGERYAGAGRGFDDIVMTTLGTGIGGAAMIGGKLLRGKHAQAGCLGGHIPVKFGGRQCTCGAIGCAEAEASGWSFRSSRQNGLDSPRAAWLRKKLSTSRTVSLRDRARPSRALPS